MKRIEDEGELEDDYDFGTKARDHLSPLTGADTPLPLRGPPCQAKAGAFAYAPLTVYPENS